MKKLLSFHFATMLYSFALFPYRVPLIRISSKLHGRLYMQTKNNINVKVNDGIRVIHEDKDLLLLWKTSNVAIASSDQPLYRPASIPVSTWCDSYFRQSKSNIKKKNADIKNNTGGGGSSSSYYHILPTWLDASSAGVVAVAKSMHIKDILYMSIDNENSSSSSINGVDSFIANGPANNVLICFAVIECVVQTESELTLIEIRHTLENQLNHLIQQGLQLQLQSPQQSLRSNVQILESSPSTTYKYLARLQISIPCYHPFHLRSPTPISTFSSPSSSSSLPSPYHRLQSMITQAALINLLLEYNIPCISSSSSSSSGSGSSNSSSSSGSSSSSSSKLLALRGFQWMSLTTDDNDKDIDSFIFHPTSTAVNNNGYSNRSTLLLSSIINITSSSLLLEPSPPKFIKLLMREKLFAQREQSGIKDNSNENNNNRNESIANAISASSSPSSSKSPSSKTENTLFHGLHIRYLTAALRPRPSSEIVVDTALKYLKMKMNKNRSSIMLTHTNNIIPINSTSKNNYYTYTETDAVVSSAVNHEEDDILSVCDLGTSSGALLLPIIAQMSQYYSNSNNNNRSDNDNSSNNNNISSTVSSALSMHQPLPLSHEASSSTIANTKTIIRGVGVDIDYASLSLACENAMALINREAFCYWQQQQFHVKLTSTSQSSDISSKSENRYINNNSSIVQDIDNNNTLSVYLNFIHGNFSQLDNILTNINIKKTTSTTDGSSGGDDGSSGSSGFDVIVSNPPYFSINTAKGRITDEAYSALVAGETGLEMYVDILTAIRRSVVVNSYKSYPLLKAGGVIIFQLLGGGGKDGHSKKKDKNKDNHQLLGRTAVTKRLIEIATSSDMGFRVVEVAKDDRGIERCLVLTTDTILQ